ncbi:hypothetical protein FOL47_003580 [Perkinsus chesapeaki]|uniref:Uncharacterized protein n=1 Tax=Perkinsus chesapeaki TaxID=330153 RepID=A0A7J6M7A0_PERCH|nr:hypothetical protein FOL47_003580 [Perkinsus chesapeaki]
MYLSCEADIDQLNGELPLDARKWFTGLLDYTAFANLPSGVGCLPMMGQAPEELVGGPERPLEFWHYPVQTHPSDHRRGFIYSASRLEQRRPVSTVSVMGLHVASSLEVGHAVSRFWPNTTVHYMGHPCLHRDANHACQFKRMMMPSSPDHDWVGEVIWQIFEAETLHERDWALDEIIDKAFRAFEDPKSDLWICTGPLPLCYIISIVKPPSTTLIVHTCASLLWGTLPPAKGLRRAVLAFARQLLMDGKLLTDYELTALQYAWQTGLGGTRSVPVVHRGSWYLPEGAVWSPPLGPVMEVLVHRGRFWARPAGQIFLRALEAILVDASIELVYGNELMPEVSTFESWTNYSVVVLALNDVTMYTFVETLHLGIPMLISGPTFAARRQKSIKYGTIEEAYAECIGGNIDESAPFLDSLSVAEALLFSDISTLRERFPSEGEPWLFWDTVDELAEILLSLTVEKLVDMSSETLKLSRAIRNASRMFWSELVV